MVGKREYELALVDVEYMPPILPEELWRRVRKKLLENPPKRGEGNRGSLRTLPCVASATCPLSLRSTQGSGVL
jgi:hypothetical protein